MGLEYLLNHLLAMKIRSQIYKVICTGLMLIAVSCDSSNPSPEAVVKPLKIDAEVASSTNEFAFSFFQTLQESADPAKNIFVSPLSLHIALGMLVNGAEGGTADEIRKVLKVEGINADKLNSAYAAYLKGLPEVDSSVDLHLANSLWYKNGIKVRQSYLNLLGTNFKAAIAAEDFSSPATVNKINQWASDNTNGKIPKVIESISSDQVLFLLNALYFKGDWYSKFDHKNTKEENFKQENGQTKKVQMMYGEHPAHFVQMEGVSGVRLGYGGGEFVMTLLMPDESTSLTDYLTSFNSSKWKSVQANLKKNQVFVGLPRFGLEYEVSLNTTLEKMGMPLAFSDQTDFSRMFENSMAKVSEVKQNTFLQIDEKGTEAAAVTTIGMVETSAPMPYVPRIVFDRPFIMVISDKATDSILFMGKMVNPESK